jgi:hypothetical protein
MAARAAKKARRPLFHLPYLYRLSFFIDWKAVRPAATGTEVSDFILRSPKVPAIEVISSYTDNVTQIQLVTVEAEHIYQEALAALRAGVPWAAAGGALVYGWAPDEALTQVCVSSVPPYLSTEAVACHMAAFSRVIRCSRGGNSDFPRAADGVVHLTMELQDANALPAYLELENEAGYMAQSCSSPSPSTPQLHRPEAVRPGRPHRWCRPPAVPDLLQLAQRYFAVQHEV